MNRGDCYRATGNVDMAMSDFHRAYDSDPNNWETKTRLSLIHHMAGLQLFNERQYEQAGAEMTIAIKYNPKVSQYFGDRGKSSYYQQNYDGAFEDYKQALKLDPNNRDVLMRMQQFDPSGSVLAEITAGTAGRGGGYEKKGVIGNLGMDLGGTGGGGGRRGPETRFSLSRTAPNTGSTTGFLPSLTPLTSVNPRLKGAQVVKDFVVSKRNAVADTLSVGQRRKEHPIKKQAHWALMAPKKIEYSSLANRRKLLNEESKNKLARKKEAAAGTSRL